MVFLNYHLFILFLLTWSQDGTEIMNMLNTGIDQGVDSGDAGTHESPVHVNDHAEQPPVRVS